MARMNKPYVAIDNSGETFPTYANVLKNLKDLLQRSNSKEVTIFRSRRGEWGEWFEKWMLRGNKPFKFKEGWM
jgi:hypothetical protein